MPGQTRARTIDLEVGLTLRLDLRSPSAALPSSAFEVRELGRDEIPGVLGVSPVLDRAPARVDIVAPSG
jgi:hypothetical protein